MLIASGRSRLTTRPTVFMDRFATAIRHLSCAEICADAKTIDFVPACSAKDRIRVVLRRRIPLAVHDRDRVDIVAGRAFAGLRFAREDDDRIAAGFARLALHLWQAVCLAREAVAQSFA